MTMTYTMSVTLTCERCPAEITSGANDWQNGQRALSFEDVAYELLERHGWANTYDMTGREHHYCETCGGP